MPFNISPSLSDLLHSVWQFLGTSCCCKWHYFILFDDWILHWIYAPQRDKAVMIPRRWVYGNTNV